MLKAIHAQESRDAADRKARTIVEDLRATKICTRRPIWSSALPDIHWRKIRTTDEIEKPRGCQPGRAAITVAPRWRHPGAVFRTTRLNRVCGRSGIGRS